MMREGWRRAGPGALLLAMLTATGVAAEDFFGEVTTETTAAPAKEPGPIRFLGWLQQKTAYGYRVPEAGFSRDRADLSRLETQLYGQATGHWRDGTLRLAGSLSHDWLDDAGDAGLWSGYELTDTQAEARQWQWHWADSYLGWQSGDFWLRGGYQTLAWGEAESLTVTDVLARRDERWPGQADLEQTRLPVPAATLNWRGQLDLAVLGWSDTHRYPAPYDEFDRLIAWRGGDTELHSDDPDQPLGVAVRWQQSWSGGDARLVLADVNAYQPGLAAVEMGMTGVEAVRLQPGRTRVVGVNLQQARGAWLWKTEQAWHEGVELAGDDPLEPWTDQAQWRGMAGVEYSGVANLTVSGEIGHIHTLDWTPDLSIERWQFSQSLRARWSTLNEALTFTAQGIGLPGDNGLVGRLSADWQANDRLSVGTTLVDYHAWEADQTLYPFRDNDAVVVTLRLGL